jgi:exosortase E/protease (VPEID-CTERM system)
MAGAFRLALLLGLLFAEYLVLVQTSDLSAAITKSPLGGLLDSLRAFAPHAILGVLAGSVHLFVSSGLGRSGPTVSWIAIAAHLAGYGALVSLSWALGGPPSSELSVPALFLAWTAAGLFTFGSWAFLAFPGAHSPRSWAPAALVALAVAALSAPSTAAQAYWRLTSRATILATKGLLAVPFSDAWARPETHEVGARAFAVRVAPECSGIESIGLGLVLLPALLWISRKELRFPAAFWLIPIGLGVLALTNVVRIASIVALGALGWRQQAVGAFHSKIGWILFGAAIFGTLVAGLRWFPAARRQTGRSEAGPYLVPELFLLGTTLLLATTGSAPRPLDPLATAAAALALVVLWPRVPTIPSSTSLLGGAIGLAIGALWVLTDPSPVAPLPPFGTGWLVARAIGTIVVVPISEELAFRGYLARKLSRSRFCELSYGQLSWPGIFLSSLAFGLLHARPIAGLLAGVGFALLARRQNSLGGALVAHMAANLCVVVAALTTGRAGLWL